MFCSSCGKKVKEEWVNCPNCGAVLKKTECKKEEIKDNASEVTVPKPRNREDIKAELIGHAFSGKNSVVIFYGAGEISRDMEKILDSDEKMLSFYHAQRTSIIGQIKSLKMFRDYIVCTDRRFLYIESGRRAFSFIPFFRKVVSIPYGNITNVSTGKRFGIYSGKVMIESTDKKINLAMLSSKEAMELEEFIKNDMK